MSTQTKESTGLQSDVMKFLYTHKQRPVPTTESNIVLTNCPHCINIRKNSFAAYLNIQKGTYKCTTCKSKGTFQEFSRNLLKKVSQPEEYPILSTSDMLHTGTKYAQFSRPMEEINRYPQALAEDTDKLEHLELKHGMDKSTWELYKVGITDVDGVSCLTFPQTDLTYDLEKESFKLDTVRLKVCELDDPTHIIQHDPPLHSKESSAGLFGYQTACADSDTLILTRREMDAMAAYQATGIPSVAIPTSNYQLQESVLPLLQRFTRVYIWMDDDMDGQLASERFAHKIGDSKCLIVNTRLGDKMGPINAYDALQAKKDMLQIVASARRIKHDQIVDFRDLREEVYNEIIHPDQSRGVQSSDLPALNKIMKGHRPGELTILTGPTGAGKTTIISQLSLDYCQSGVPTLWGSFEILNKRLAKKMLFQFAGKDISLVPSEFEEIADRFQELPLYFLKFFSSTAIKDVLKACHHAVYAYDVRHIVLDNLQFMLSQQGRSSLDKWDLQDNAIAEIRQFATEQDVHITLVVHPRKDMGEELDINSIFGSAKVTQEADNVVIIQKSHGKIDSRSLDIKKNRYDGTLGVIPYKFLRETQKIRECTIEEIQEQRKAKYASSQSTEVKVRRPYK
ncbi:mitochondrial helicase twinkle [Mucor mucedo]|uniref:mitochondrial helicase twinkle n=1 Tax=Mucor mucedo TaxID=29922 RepID=UPI0022202CC4|nr:mitochondrial helicase twinkle [Mucor mucedo]KAI7897003.1 mitochondrial helicase twinkle [Mucor mucedo]